MPRSRPNWWSASCGSWSSSPASESTSWCWSRRCSTVGVDEGEVAYLFLRRWNIELDLRPIKSVLQMDVLRCKTPEKDQKEMWMHLLAYNLIRGVMAKAAEAHDEQLRR